MGSVQQLRFEGSKLCHNDHPQQAFTQLAEDARAVSDGSISLMRPAGEIVGTSLAADEQQQPEQQLSEVEAVADADAEAAADVAAELQAAAAPRLPDASGGDKLHKATAICQLFSRTAAPTDHVLCVQGGSKYGSQGSSKGGCSSVLNGEEEPVLFLGDPVVIVQGNSFKGLVIFEVDRISSAKQASDQHSSSR